MAERRPGGAAEITLTVGTTSLPLDETAGRSDLVTGFARRTQDRTLPGGIAVTLPLTVRDGTITCTVLRTRTTDQLCGWNQQRGTLRIRSQGTGSGLPQRSLPVLVQTTLTVVQEGLSAWRVQMRATGALDDTPQS